MIIALIVAAGAVLGLALVVLTLSDFVADIIDGIVG